MEHQEQQFKRLVRRVASAVVDALDERLPRLVRKATEKPYLTREAVKGLTGWSDRTLQHLRDTRQIPFIQDGRKILYPTQDFYEFLEERRVQTRSGETSRGTS